MWTAIIISISLIGISKQQFNSSKVIFELETPFFGKLTGQRFILHRRVNWLNIPIRITGVNNEYFIIRNISVTFHRNVKVVTCFEWLLPRQHIIIHTQRCSTPGIRTVLYSAARFPWRIQPRGTHCTITKPSRRPILHNNQAIQDATLGYSWLPGDCVNVHLGAHSKYLQHNQSVITSKRKIHQQIWCHSHMTRHIYGLFI